MTRRRAALVGGAVIAIVVAVLAVGTYRSSHRAPSGCDTVHALIAYNVQFAGQMKSSAGTAETKAVTPDQYTAWAQGVRDYAEKISDPELAAKADTAAGLAGRLAGLVPRYRANPDDPVIAREYAGLGIEFGNAINRLEYSCPGGR